MARNRYPRRKTIPLMVQVAAIFEKYPELIESKKMNNKLCEILLKVTPSKISRTYIVRLELRQGLVPRVYIVSPNIAEENTENEPPHMYSLEKGQICLFLPDEITPYENYSRVVPWISEWLFFYETWKITGKWYGRGHGTKEKQDD